MQQHTGNTHLIHMPHALTQILEHVAAQLGLDTEAVREANFMRRPVPAPLPAPAPGNPTADGAADGTAGSNGTNGHANGHANGSNGNSTNGNNGVQQQQEQLTPKDNGAAKGGSTPAAAPTTANGGGGGGGGAGAGPAGAGQQQQQQQDVVRLPLGSVVPGQQYTLPRLWEQLRRDMDWDRMQVGWGQLRRDMDWDSMQGGWGGRGEFALRASASAEVTRRHSSTETAALSRPNPTQQHLS